MPEFKSKTIGGVEYKLPHLDSFVMPVVHDDISYRVYVLFSCHCFTEEVQSWHSPDRRYVHAGEVRSFDKIRYNMSLKLPGIIRGLSGHAAYLGKDKNYFVLRNTDLLGNGPPYMIPFHVSRDRNRKRSDVFMRIQSAHPKPNMVERAAPVDFCTLIYATATSQPITPGRVTTIKRK